MTENIKNRKQAEKKLTLRNKQGKTITMLLRPYREGDEMDMIACIRDEYGDTYFKRAFYDPEHLKREAEEGVITFLVAETQDGEIAGMMILKQFYPEEFMCEIASQIFLKKYRGFGMAMPFFEYGMDILLSRSYSAAFCLPVLFHDVTQRLLYRLGLRATGLVMNVFDMDHIMHSYCNGRNSKHSQGIQVRAIGKKDAGTLYIPREHVPFCSKIYDSLGVKCHIRENSNEKEEFSGYSGIICQNNREQQSLEIRIYRVGADFKSQMEQIHTRYPLQGKQTANVFLNCNEPQAIYAYSVLKEMGYFFTGLKPLCSEREYMVLHHPGEVGIWFEDYVVSDEFSALITYVEANYEEQKRLNEMQKRV